MNNLKYAKMFLGFGILVGLSIPISVIYNQTLQSQKRKKNILVDHERMRQKLEKNPNLKFNTELKALPFNESNLENLYHKHEKNN